MPRVSVVIPAYNHEKYVAQAIQSVLDQTFQDFEIVMTDDGSSDRTVDVIKSFNDPRIRLFCHLKNRGASIAANHSVQQAEGEFIAMLSSDDAFVAEKLEKQVDFLDQNPEIGAVFSHVQPIDQDGNDFADEHFYTKIFLQSNHSRSEWLNRFFYEGNCLCHPSALIRRQCYQEVGYYDSRFAQLPDFDFWVRLCSHYEIYILPAKLLKFRVHHDESNASGIREDSRKRTAIEYKQVLQHYLKPPITEHFTDIFQISYPFHDCHDVPDQNSVQFLIARLALQVNSPIHKSFAIDTLYELFKCEPHLNQTLTDQIRQCYGFEFIDLIQLAGEQDVFGLVQVDQFYLSNQQAGKTLEQLGQTLEQTNLQLYSTQTELEQTTLQLHSTQAKAHAELEQTTLQLHNTQAELENLARQLQATIQQSQLLLEQSQAQLLQQQAEMGQLHHQHLHLTRDLEVFRFRAERLQNKLQKSNQAKQTIQEQLEYQLKQSQAEVNAMKTSKFWKMRVKWFQIKKIFGLKID